MPKYEVTEVYDAEGYLIPGMSGELSHIPGDWFLLRDATYDNGYFTRYYDRSSREYNVRELTED